MTGIYDQDLEKNAANYESLSPISFMQRAALLFPDKDATVYGDITYTWRQSYERAHKIASALNLMGVKRGDTVAAMLPNIPEMFELHFAIPMCGGVFNAINTRLDAKTVAFILQHAETKILFADSEYAEVITKALAILKENVPAQSVLVVNVEDPSYSADNLIGKHTYQCLLNRGSLDYKWQLPEDEWEAISLNYTSGTTGNPKGVVYHHRGAYLNATNNALSWEMGLHPRYLWTLPMFHCNGWCFPWTMAVVIGTNICLRQVREDAIFAAFKTQQVSHFCGAPVVLNLLVNADADLKQDLPNNIKVMTAGAAPPAAIIEGMENLDFDVTHVYGLTETYGPMVISQWRPEWDELPAKQKAKLKARQGISSVLAGAMQVADAHTLEPVPWDGKTQGEVFMKGNIVMKGYLKNPSTTAAAFAGGWFHSGDLAVCHPDGYIQIKDRSKDIIISGGENISSIEIEDVLFQHPKILEAAVVAKSDEKWGERPCAFVTLMPGQDMTEGEVVDFCQREMARFKAPHCVVFGPLTKTATGKIQKYLLREQAEKL